MSDIVDDAQRHIDAERDAAIARIVARSVTVSLAVSDRTCRGCAEWIGMDRLHAVPNTVLCIECATTLEQCQRPGARQ